MKPVSHLAGHPPGTIRGVLFDIDDTFTLHGRILDEAYSALWRLHERGLVLVPITGRPAGWCDHIARMWPVDGVVGENGAFYYHYSAMDHKLYRRNVNDPEAATANRDTMECICREALQRVPHAAVAADQPFRMFDLAIDFAEDVSPLTGEEIEKICTVFSEHGAVCKVSSIHVNGWFGGYDKLTTAKLFIEERLALPWEEARASFVFAGDSPNDEPMFEAFPLSVGVANVRKFMHVMRHVPTYVTSKEGGLGFAEMAAVLLERME
ncbi:MAG: HAD-IIB family hydrolase [Spirochaetes bacterium]|nr:HAD-IIB family hydrolase [Spirochaetota bacterium]